MIPGFTSDRSLDSIGTGMSFVTKYTSDDTRDHVVPAWTWTCTCCSGLICSSAECRLDEKCCCLGAIHPWCVPLDSHIC